MSAAAARIDQPGAGCATEGRSGRPLLRCVLMDDSGFDRRVVRRIARNSRYELDVVETTGIAETRRALAVRPADLLLLDYRVPDGDGIAFARELSADERHGGIPVVLVTGVGSEHAAIQAIRSGIADYLSKDGLTIEQFDQAIENALRRSAAGAADQARRCAELMAENAALRRGALGNMRGLKGHVLPLLSFAHGRSRGSANESAGAEQVQELGRVTRAILGLIDETVILAATHRHGEEAVPVDLADVVAAVLADEDGQIRDSGARVTVGPLPVLRARISQMLLLVEELMLGAVRAARLGSVPEIEIASVQDAEGNPVVTFAEKGVRLAARRRAAGARFARLGGAGSSGAAADVYPWSLCQRIVERHGGRFTVAASGNEGCVVHMRFPRSMLA